jgi:hypothetical protein
MQRHGRLAQKEKRKKERCRKTKERKKSKNCYTSTSTRPPPPLRTRHKIQNPHHTPPPAEGKGQDGKRWIPRSQPASRNATQRNGIEENALEMQNEGVEEK